MVFAASRDIAFKKQDAALHSRSHFCAPRGSPQRSPRATPLVHDIGRTLGVKKAVHPKDQVHLDPRVRHAHRQLISSNPDGK